MKNSSVQPEMKTKPLTPEQRQIVGAALQRLIEGWYTKDPGRREMIDQILAEASANDADLSIAA